MTFTLQASLLRGCSSGKPQTGAHLVLQVGLALGAQLARFEARCTRKTHSVGIKLLINHDMTVKCWLRESMRAGVDTRAVAPHP